MSDTRGPAAAANNKLAMSKALGAAFLNHQVEQLEKSVNANGPSGNWRDRRYRAPAQEYQRSGNYNRRPANGAGQRTARLKGGAADRTDLGVGDEREKARKDGGSAEKDADVVVVDASVLVHALPQVKKWCRDGRQEVVIVPLEALNTLDLLKKGSTSLAQRARAASRILEAQVGVNPRIRVQRDDAFVLWDNIPFQDQAAAAAGVASPEWVRRTVCCARWEVEHPTAADRGSNAKAGTKATTTKELKVVLAVLAPAAEQQQQQQQPHGHPEQDAVSASPVPLPAPQPNRFEPRSAGTLVAHWAARAGIALLQVAPAPPDAHAPGGRRSPDDDRALPRGGRGRRNSHQRNDGRAPTPGGGGGGGSGNGGLVERPPAVMAMMEMVAQPSRVVRVLARGEKLDPN